MSVQHKNETGITAETKGPIQTPIYARHMGLEYCRIFAACMVVINHAWAIDINASKWHFYITLVLNSIVVTAVPLFILLSGAFLITNKKISMHYLFGNIVSRSYFLSLLSL